MTGLFAPLEKNPLQMSRELEVEIDVEENSKRLDLIVTPLLLESLH